MIRFERLVVGYLDTNCWIIAPDVPGRPPALIVDPGDDPDYLAAAAASYDVVGVLLTHAHADHVLALTALAESLNTPIIGHPAEREVWAAELDHLKRHGYLDAGTATADLVANGQAPRPTPGVPLWNGHLDQEITAPTRLSVGPLDVRVIPTPGHSPGSLSLYADGHLFTGDTLFPGGPGLTSPDYPLTDFDAIMQSVRDLLAYPPNTVIHPGHGPDTTVGTELPYLETWQSRGW
ncbi:MBL fold metallo-hydrolase [Kribbella sp. NPDC056345]|uniref:MBL fold metallo-hydrolase n=1 Tax=Kribbella sp. NPDC056345 TaxID=3345789 RepID=UPI0035E1EE57